VAHRSRRCCGRRAGHFRSGVTEVARFAFRPRSVMLTGSSPRSGDAAPALFTQLVVPRGARPTRPLGGGRPPVFSAIAIAGRDQWGRHSIDVAPVDVPVPEQSELRVVVSEDPWFAPVDDDVRR
jgi:hypothetical protein